MPTTDFALPALGVSGSFVLENTGYFTSSGGTYTSYGYHHANDHFSESFTFGTVTVSCYATTTIYRYGDPTPGEWTKISGVDVTGYPAALSNGGYSYAVADVRAFWTKVDGPDAEDTTLEDAGHYVQMGNTWPLTNPPTAQSLTNCQTSQTFTWTIDLDPIPLTKSETYSLPPAQSKVLHASDRIMDYNWEGDVAWEGTCGLSSSDGSIAWSGKGAPTWGLSHSYGAGVDSGTWFEQTFCPDGEEMVVALAHYGYGRLADSQTISFSLPTGYTYVSDSEEDTDYAEYSINTTTAVGTVESASSTACADPEHGGPWGHQEGGHITSSLSVIVAPFDQMTSMSGDGLECTNPWTSAAFSVPGTASITQSPHNRNSETVLDDAFRVLFTDASLATLDLPLADHHGIFTEWALDRITYDSADWGTYDQYGGHYHGLVKFGLQSPLSVQWAQDDRGASAPPSWWTDVADSSALTRENTIEAVLDTTLKTGVSSITRTLAWATFRTDADMLTAPPGTPDADLWRYGFNFENTYEATKHLLEGEQVYGDTEGGKIPWSEDVWCWNLYRTLRLVVSCDAADGWTIGVVLSYSPTPEIYDPFYTDAEDRAATYTCDWSTQSVTYTASVPATAVEENIDIDLIAAGAPDLYRVNSITITGIPPGPATEFRLHDVQLLAPSADVRLECASPRKVRYGGEPRYTCGAEPEYLGLAQPPEEFNGRWLFGGHRPLTIPCDGGRSVDIAPRYGLKNIARRVNVPDCGALQDFEKDWPEWYNELLGTWGQEGLYGVAYDSPTDTAMANWVDAADEVLGPNYVTDPPQMLWEAIADGDFLAVGRGADGPYDPPITLRVGWIAPAEGMCWANSEEGDAPVWPVRHIFYGSRVATTYSGTAVWTRGAAAATCSLYEQEVGASSRLVDTENTDADGRVRFSAGVNEFRHNEPGADTATNPDYTNRSDYLSDVLVPGETTDALSFGAHHYQPIPTWLLQPLEAIASEYDWDIDQAGRIWAAYIDESGDVRVVWADQLPLSPAWRDAGTPLSGATDWTCPSIVADTDAGRVLVCATSAAATSFSHGTRCSGEGAVTMEWSEVSSDMAQIGDSLTLCDIAYRQGVTALAGYSGGTVYFERSSRDDLSRDELTAGVYQIEVAAAAEERPAVAIGDDGSYLVAVRVGAGIQRYRCAEFSAGFELIDEVTA